MDTKTHPSEVPAETAEQFFPVEDDALWALIQEGLNSELIEVRDVSALLNQIRADVERRITKAK